MYDANTLWKDELQKFNGDKPDIYWEYKCLNTSNWINL